MKLIPLLLILVLLSSGCLLQQQTAPLLPQEDYVRNQILDTLTFTLPQKYTNQIAIDISLTLPSGENKGVLRRVFEPKTTCLFKNINTILYYPGLWHIDYNIYNGSTKVIEGDHNFWVSDATRLDRYEVEKETRSGNNLYFSIKNTGKSSGYVNIVVYRTEPISIEGVLVYGREYFNERVYLKPGHRYEQTITVEGDVKIMLNGV